MRRPNRSGSVIKLSGKRRRPFAIRIWDGVKINDKGLAVPVYKYVGYYEKRADALRDLEKYNTSPVELIKEQETTKKHKFSEIYEMWTDELGRRSKPLSPQSYSSYAAAYQNLKPLHNQVFENLTLEDLENAALANSHKSLSSVSNIKIVLKGMYKTAIRHRFVTEDISALMILNHNTEMVRPHTIFTDEEIATLWEHKDDFYGRLLLILIYTGMRIQELLSTKTENIFLDEHYLVGGSKTKAGKDRMIPLSDKILPLLDVSQEYLITKDGEKLTYGKANKELETYMKSQNMAHKFHDTRHTCATLMERAKVPELHRKLILGHSSTDITDRYTHVSIQELVLDINKI